VLDAVERVAAQCLEAGRTVGHVHADMGELAGWRAKGASLFLLSSDTAFLRAGAASSAPTRV
jgi:2-keto-3-deoxy-L-rhamnonate aldolase RhmA